MIMINPTRIFNIYEHVRINTNRKYFEKKLVLKKKNITEIKQGKYVTLTNTR